MAEVKHLACDLCGGTPAWRWTMREDDKRGWSIDLCQEHQQPVMALREHARYPDEGRRTYRNYGVKRRKKDTKA